MPHYVITQPEAIKGIYVTWDECKLKVDGVKGARYQKVHDLDQAKALLEGQGVILSPGLHVFTDGNHLGGVGVVSSGCPAMLTMSRSSSPRSRPRSAGSSTAGWFLSWVPTRRLKPLWKRVRTFSPSWAVCISLCGKPQPAVP